MLTFTPARDTIGRRMKENTSRGAAGPAVLCVLTALLATGCASTHAYFSDRGRDAADIVSVSVGTGIGAKARVSALSFGLLYEGDVAGIRGGSAFAGHPGDYCYDVQFLTCCNEYFAPPGSEDRHKRFHAEQRFGIDSDGNAGAGRGVWCLMPPMCLSPLLPLPPDMKPSALHYYMQIDLVAAVGGGLRVGLNPGELVDFLLGWVGVDFMKDDLAMRRRREAPTVTPPSAPAGDLVRQSTPGRTVAAMP